MPAVPGGGAPYKIPLTSGEWHEDVRQLWQALRKSQQAQQFYQPSDWAYAYLWMGVLSAQLEGEKPSAMMLATIDSAFARLLVTEGDRRRMRIELEKPDDGTAAARHDAKVTRMAAYRSPAGA